VNDKSCHWSMLNIHCVSKIRATFIFMITSANMDQLSLFSLLSIFSLLNSERICGGKRNYNCHLPSNLLPHYSTVNLVQSDETFNFSKCSRGIIFLCLSIHWLIYVKRLKCPPSAYTGCANKKQSPRKNSISPEL